MANWDQTLVKLSLCKQHDDIFAFAKVKSGKPLHL